MIKKSGYLWKCYGFTMTHMWGLHLVSMGFGLIGVGMLAFALLGIPTLEQDLFYRILAGSAVVLIADIATILYSLFSIHFYRFTEQAPINDEPNKTVEATPLRSVPHL